MNGSLVDNVVMTSEDEPSLEEWNFDVATAETMIPVIGHLYRNNNVVLMLFGTGLVNKSVIELIKIHRLALKYLHGQITVGNRDPRCLSQRF